jgi:hypothetical protein
VRRTRRAEATLAGPAPPPELAEHGDGVDVERTVNASSRVSLAGRSHSIGYQVAGQRVTACWMASRAVSSRRR